MTLHPQSKSFIEAMRVADAPAWQEMTIEQARKTFNELPIFGDAPEVADVADHQLAGINVRIYRPQADGDAIPPATIVFFHGGGWVLGGLDSHDALCRRLAIAADLPVVSVEYRQPPEDPFPAAAEDCFTVCDALSVEHGQLNLSANMILAGDSAGGNLAAVVGLMARERGGPPLLGQVLIYPVLDASMSTDSYQQFATDHGLTAETMAWFWQNYTGNTSARRNPLACPDAASDFSGLPPTHLIVAEYDVLRDEGLQFARRLSDAGVPTTLEHCDGMLHGFVHFAGVFDEAAIVTKQIGKQCRRWASAD
tara:strand:- start:756683 stop:757609 length:927 start_codon:yes stop_codon:yes gene_type:complete